MIILFIMNHLIRKTSMLKTYIAILPLVIALLTLNSSSMIRDIENIKNKKELQQIADSLSIKIQKKCKDKTCRNLCQAAENNCILCILQYLKGGFDPNFQRSKSLNTPLDLAFCRSPNNRNNMGSMNLDTITLLLHYNANPNIKNKLGKTPWHYCTHTENTKLINAFPDYAPAACVDNEGGTILHYACKYGTKTFIDELLKYYSNPTNGKKLMGYQYKLDKKYKEKAWAFLLVMKKIQMQGTLKMPKSILYKILSFLNNNMQSMLKKFINQKDNDGKTARNVAAKRAKNYIFATEWEIVTLLDAYSEKLDS